MILPITSRAKPLSDPRKALRRILDAAGIDKPFRIHDTRHTFASLLVASGISLYTVQKQHKQRGTRDEDALAATSWHACRF
ncbi:tyrosine-type recombinase/integrase [Burkholderia sp. AU38729]|uniref:tyrosine-type recombinase/integrase n=1 Tax=Burkholderia sp. AU38729 TaxID=2879633 RepID=UPI0021F46FC7|nr:tyrosine-type recombinase/integrase [Burkholderia sp. AU38729]